MTTKIQPLESVLVRKMGNEAIVLNLKTETYYLLNSTGIRIWEALITEETIEKIAEQLSVEYEVSPDVIRGDVEELIQQLHAAKLININE